MYYPALAEYCKLAETYNLVPVYREYPADTETPVSVYHKLSPAPPCFLLESVAGGTTQARYSFIGMACFLNFRYSAGAEYWGAEGRARLPGDPLAALRELVSRYQTPALPNLPPFISGGVGYFGYDLVRFFESLPPSKQNDPALPLCRLMFPGVVLAFDHLRRTLLVVANLPVTGRPADTYQAAVAKIDRVAKQIFASGQSPVSCPLRGAPAYSQSLLDRYLAEGAVFGRSRFEAAVSRALDYIRAGEIFQVVLSQRFDLPFDGNPFDFYRWLRLLNPSPYHFYLNFGALTVVGCSPEMLVRVTGPKVTTHPIAGTRPRGSHAAEDDRLAAELLADEKERAEHLMLVDLGRNDLGRVCRPGTVQVPSFMQVERYSHVMHLVSEVTGLLEAGRTGLDALAACFPAGTVSGAPKIRAMEIIDELEPVSRGLYAGAVGYLDFAGQLDTAITIRTAVLHGGKAYLQAGAGIVADSQPAREYQECLHKARAMAAALLAATAGERGYGLAGGNR